MSKLDAAPKEPASEPVAPVIEPLIEMPVVTRPGYEPLKKTPEQKAADEAYRAEREAADAAKRAAVGAPHPTLNIPPELGSPRPFVPDEKPLGDMTTEEILQKYPQLPPKPLEQFTVNELIAFKSFGPAMIGGVLYLASQAAVVETGAGTLGPAILSKGFTPVPFVSHVNGDQ